MMHTNINPYYSEAPCVAGRGWVGVQVALERVYQLGLVYAAIESRLEDSKQKTFVLLRHTCGRTFPHNERCGIFEKTINALSADD